MMEKSGLANLVRQTIIQPVIVDNLPEHAADEERVNALIGDHHHARLFTELQEFRRVFVPLRSYRTVPVLPVRTYSRKLENSSDFDVKPEKVMMTGKDTELGKKLLDGLNSKKILKLEVIDGQNLMLGQ